MTRKTARRRTTIAERRLSSAADLLDWLLHLKSTGTDLEHLRMSHPRPRYAEVYSASVVLVPLDDFNYVGSRHHY